MFIDNNIFGHDISAVKDLSTFITNLQKIYAQNCAIDYFAHGVTIINLLAKIVEKLSQKLRRERQIIQALDRVRNRGEKSATVKDLVIEIYGESLDEGTRTLELKLFVGEVLRKLAGDNKVAFEMRGGKKKWYSVDSDTADYHVAVLTSTVHNVQVQAIATL